mgnify:CR=1 FL=1
MFEKLIKNKLKLNSALVILITFLLILSFILPQVIAITSIQSKSKINNFNIKPYTSELSAEPIVFIKPVLKKMYIGDKAELSLNGNRSIIIGPITLQVATEIQNELISVKYQFIDMNNNSLGPDVLITWSEKFPNFDCYYAKRHFPIFQDVLPSKFKIIATAQFIGIPYAQTNITVFKIF